jgi:hypothetical protein
MESFDISLSDKDFTATFLVRPVQTAGRLVYEIWDEDNHWLSVGDVSGKQSDLLLTGEFSHKNISGELVSKVSDAILEYLKTKIKSSDLILPDLCK